jgi:hypothetical protein
MVVRGDAVLIGGVDGVVVFPNSRIGRDSGGEVEAVLPGPVHNLLLLGDLILVVTHELGVYSADVG